MKIIDIVMNQTKDIWNQCVNTRFLTEMMDGTLDKSTFLDYIVQDSLYLRDYLKAFAMGMYKSKTLKDMQVFYSVLGFINDSENATRLNYLKDYDMTDDDVERISKLPECEAYTAYERKISESEDIPEILMATLPCMLGYYSVFCKVRAQSPTVMNGYFAPLVADYSSDLYKECCKYWADYTNQLCTDFPKERIEKLCDIFYKASMHELYFWQMAGKEI